MQHVVKAAYYADTCDDALLYLDGRLRRRWTYVQLGQVVLWPIQDTVGLVQDGCTPDRLFRLNNTEQLSIAQLRTFTLVKTFVPIWKRRATSVIR